MVNRWLLLAVQLPAQPSNARVKTWRRLQQLGAVSVKNSVHVLPNSAQALEDFEWLRAEIEGVKGQATIFSASSIDGVDEGEIIEQFRAARVEDYKAFRHDLAHLRSPGTRASGRGDELSRTIRLLRDRLDQIRQIDFFSAPGSQEAERELSSLERANRRENARPPASPAAHVDRQDYKRRLWVTRPRPGVDRFASAWLISRFIDPAATFGFASDATHANRGVPFDMYDGGFRHERDQCTFEVLQARFAITDPSVRRIAEIVHDLDLKDDRFRPPHAVAVGALVDGLRAAYSDDGELLRQGIVLFEALYQGLQQPNDHEPTTRTRATKSRAKAAKGEKS